MEAQQARWVLRHPRRAAREEGRGAHALGAPGAGPCPAALVHPRSPARGSALRSLFWAQGAADGSESHGEPGEPGFRGCRGLSGVVRARLAAALLL